MPLTAAERAQRYREKLKQNPDKFQEQRQKQLKRLQKSRKRIKDLTEEEKDCRRKQWREEKKKQKLKRKKETEDERLKSNAPSSSKSQKSAASILKIRYNKICRSYRAASQNNRQLKSRNEAIRKKLYREKLAHEAKVRELQNTIDKLIARQEILELSMRQTYRATQTLSEKTLLKSIAVNPVVKTNRSVNAVATCLGLKGRIRQSKKKIALNKDVQEEMKHFYIRDDISRNTAGKRETKTRGKKKMQIRYLTDTLQNLYQIYKREGGTYSFTTFFRYKPYYVLSPTAKNRDTCMCVKHSNMEYLFIALKNKNIVDYKNLEETINKSVCDKNTYACMYDDCENCNNQNLKYKEDKFEDEITWFKWERVTHTYQKSDKNFTTKKTVKQEKKGKVLDLVTEFEAEFPKFKRHYYNWKEQQRQYRICINNLTEKEIAILIDFSENYESKLGSEIQAMHFGASKNSISLHCGMIYWNDKSQSFVTISNNNCHEPNAIWAHLLPILQFIKKLDPTIEIIHFFSDGPTSQYRQKKNFFLINLFTGKLKLKYITWSFSESGHGKGVADGIGGAVKRQLDRHVAYGHDVIDANDAYKHLSNSLKSVKCFTVSDSDIENMNKIIPRDLKAVPQTMKLHQIISVDIGQIMYRILSCFCGDKRGLCTCLNLETHSFHSDQSHGGSQTAPVVHLEMTPRNNNRGEQTVSVTETAPCGKTDQDDIGVHIVSASDQSATPTDEYDQNDRTGHIISVVDVVDTSSDKNSGGQTASIFGIASCSKTNQSDRSGQIDSIVDIGDAPCDGNSGERIASLLTYQSDCDGQTGNVTDLNVSLNRKGNQTDSIMMELKVDDVVDLDMFDNIIENPQPGFDLVLDTVDCLTKDYDNAFLKMDVELGDEKENNNKRKNTGLALNIGSSKKKLKVPIKHEIKYQSRSLKTIVNRNFICHLCKLRRLYVITDMTKCIACKNWVCRPCCGKPPAIDYICDRCYGSSD